MNSCAGVRWTRPCSTRSQEFPGLDPRVIQTRSLAVPPLKSDAVAATAAKNEQLAGEGIVIERGLHKRREAVEAFAHVGSTGDPPDAGAGR